MTLSLTEPLPQELVVVMQRAACLVPIHRMSEAQRDVRWCLDYIGTLRREVMELREAKAEALKANHTCREHHHREHIGCQGQAA